jgi:hypothetical protein
MAQKIGPKEQAMRDLREAQVRERERDDRDRHRDNGEGKRRRKGKGRPARWPGKGGR